MVGWFVRKQEPISLARQNRTMKRNHWGKLADGSDDRKELDANDLVLTMSKMDKFQQIKLPYTITREKR